MGIENTNKISRYYDYFRDKEVVFTKANLNFLRMDPRQIYLKCNGGQWPCIINSTSLQMAKVIVGTSSGAYVEINKKKETPVSLRFCFIDEDGSPIFFFVNCTVTEVKPYQGSNELAIVTLTFTQRPPDDLIVRVGEFVEVNENFNIRKEERIGINKNSMRELGILKEESVIFIANVPRRCILKDVSFGGARVMLLGIPKFLQDKIVQLRLLFSDTNEQVALNGSVVNAVFMEGRKDISIVNIQFNANEIPMSYKFHINRYITSYQKKIIENQMKNAEAAAKAAQEEAKKAEEAKAAREKKIAENMAAEKEEEKNAILAKVAAAKAAQNGTEGAEGQTEGEKPVEAQTEATAAGNTAGESANAEASSENKEASADSSEPKASEGSDEIIDTEGHEFIKSAAEEKAESFKNNLDDQLESAIENATDISK
ncbi:PilZ domain-containing protein [Treponema sp. C6A8]|uniref:PilZ domain-containing protein n=1 Tax=Treponema sp. C6A8 TaxID=1410609 RepID=UPI000685C6C9|nr:PilZ domain-containing protein [Treponema sp. C6A8]